MPDAVAELRRCDYTAASRELNGLGAIRSRLREVEKFLYLAERTVPAALVVVEAARGLRRYPTHTVSAEIYGTRLVAADE